MGEATRTASWARRAKSWARDRVPAPLRSRVADLGFLAEVPLARMRIDRHRVPLGPDDVDAEHLAATVDPDQHTRAADEYFGAGLEGTDAEARRGAHLLKPFHDPAEAATHLAAFASLICGLDLAPGMRVLDFGSGAGWTSRLMAQMGCEVLLCDVSGAALDTAAHGFAQHQPILPPGTPTPRGLPFDGRRLELADASVDRVVCFDALHHVPDHPGVIAELSRVLVDGGVAGFHEPGPDHSRRPASQFEMSHHGFLERDLLIEPIWAAARDAGFDRFSLNLVGPTLTGVRLRTYDRVLRFGAIPLAFRRRLWHMAATSRVFFLGKGPPSVPDSRRATALGGVMELVTTDRSAADVLRVRVRAHNTGTARWLPADSGTGAVGIGAHRVDQDGRMVESGAVPAQPVGPGVAPGQAAEVTVALPALPAGAWHMDLQSDGVCWFSKQGSPTLEVR